MLPLTIVVFGATGDLFKKKLTEAFFDICQKKKVFEIYTIIGLSRKLLSHSEFRDLAKLTLAHVGQEDEVDAFLARLYYYNIDATDLNSLIDLREILDRLDQDFGMSSNKLFYIATVPGTYEEIFKNISLSGLGLPCIGGVRHTVPWTRIVVEKPFGSDLKSAIALDQLLGQSFKENQIYRIDHYLAKETVQAIYAFRFENTLFGDIWNKDNIERVHIFAFEDEKKDNVEPRKVFYDAVGALRDFGQNHLLELLSLIAMNKGVPSEIRTQRARVLAQVRVKDDSGVVFGQYEGYKTAGFETSQTETYFKAVLFVDAAEWEGVPFVLEHGKMLHQTKTGISIFFKSAAQKPNTIHFSIQPDASICVDLNVNEGVSKQMCFDLGNKENQFIYPYEKLLLDLLAGDQTLFVSTDEVKEEWRIAEAIQQKGKTQTLQVYKKGSSPEAIAQ